MNISKRYCIELNKINNHLADLERGHIYELTRTPGTPSCATLAQHLKEDIASLLDLIENDKPGVAEFDWFFGNQSGSAVIELTDSGYIDQSSTLNCNKNCYDFSRPLGAYNDDTLYDVFGMMLRSQNINYK